MRCEYTVTFEDFREAVKCYRKVSRRAAVGYWFYVWILPAISLVVSLACLLAYMRRNDGDYAMFFWPFCIGLGVAWGFPARYQLSLRRGFKQRNVLAQNKPMFVEFDDTTIRFMVPQGTEVSYPWASFTDYFENDRVAVLFVQQALFHIIPKRTLEKDCLVQLRQLVNRHVRKS